ncbi:MAG: hypothetical protein PHV34_03730 [Verrucomicrobiae bacterium]|nr:hypothetical protein [Verrucomicrobiae bacterium]
MIAFMLVSVSLWENPPERKKKRNDREGLSPRKALTFAKKIMPLVSGFPHSRE